MARLLSVNVGLPRDIEWHGRTVHTGIWKDAGAGAPPRRGGSTSTATARATSAATAASSARSSSTRSSRTATGRSGSGRRDFTYGQFGENFTIEGLPDDEVCIGDRYRIGSALFEVTQPRVTCYRVGIRMDEPRMAALLTVSGRPGFYFRVLEEGEVGAGDAIVKVARGPERMTVAEVNALLYLAASSSRASSSGRCASRRSRRAGARRSRRCCEARTATRRRRATRASCRRRLRTRRRPGSGRCGSRGSIARCVDVISLVAASRPTDGRSRRRCPASSSCCGCARRPAGRRCSAATRSPARPPPSGIASASRSSRTAPAGRYLSRVRAGRRPRRQRAARQLRPAAGRAGRWCS